ncbi:MAG: inosine/xanthosine triphosphatase [Nitrososphaerota archaeon]
MAMRVGVGSMNEVKIEAVKMCFEKFFGVVEVAPVSVDVPPQPIGFEETLRGAVIRAWEALRKADADLGVGIEAGLMRILHSITGYVDQHVCAIIDSDERVTLGFSMTLEFPVIVVERILGGRAREAEEVMEEISGIREIGRKGGAVGYLTRDRVRRIDLCAQAIVSALIPRLNPELYNVEWPKAREILREKP